MKKISDTFSIFRENLELPAYFDGRVLNLRDYYFYEVFGIHEIVEAVNGLMDHEGQVFSLVEGKNRVLRLNKTNNFDAVASAVKACEFMIECDFFDVHQLNPKVNVFCDSIVKYGIKFSYFECLPNSDLNKAVNLLNDFANQVIMELNSVEFKKKNENYLRGIYKNYAELDLFVKEVVETKEKVFISRIEFGYKEGIVCPRAGENSPCYEKFKKNKSDFFKNWKVSSVFKGVVAYIWRVECSSNRILGWHVIFFHDYDFYHDDVVRILGEYWVEKITKGDGFYLDCYNAKFKYRKCGIGLIESSDLEMAGNKKCVELRKAIDNMAGVDYYAKLFLPKKGRRLGHSGRLVTS